jgi:GxxExxY protein
MDVNDLSKQLIGYCIKIHKQLGVGLFESIYEEALSYELNKNEISFQRQIEIPVIYENKQLGIGFKADFIIEQKVILELKSVEKIAPIHKKQLLTYLKITGIQLGLLINFNEILLKDGITRIKN